MSSKSLNITLKPLREEDKNEFKNKIQESFGIALKENFNTQETIPSDQELDEAFAAPNNESFCIFNGNQKVGGAIININSKTLHNSLELFFIYAGKHSSGLGLAAWQAIEKLYPQTKVWETVTPYFEKRNINFYVNKCGFHIVEFCNKHHICQNEHYIQENSEDIPGTEEFFRFEKTMF